MGEWLGAIEQVTGPLTLIAFLAVVLLALFRRSVKDERGLEYLYKLMSAKLTRKDFYALAMRALNLSFAACILIFTLGVGGFVMIKLNEGSPPASQPLVSGNRVSGDVVAIGSGNPVVATGGSQITLGGPASAPSAIPQTGEQHSLIIQRERGNIILSGDGSESIRVPNSGTRVDGEQRLSDAYRIDIQPGHRSTQALRDLYALQPLASTASMDENEEYFFPADRAGLFGFTVPWIVGEANFTRYPFSPMSAGSAVLEVHKRPSGVFTLAGFVTQSEAQALAGLTRSQQPVDINLTTAPVAGSQAAVSVPLARIDSLLLGSMGMQDLETNVSVISLRVW